MHRSRAHDPTSACPPAHRCATLSRVAAPDASPSLTDLLAEPPPASVLALPAESQQRLAALLVGAREREKQQGDAAVERAIKGVPLPVRGVVRKALVG